MKSNLFLSFLISILFFFSGAIDGQLSIPDKIVKAVNDQIYGITNKSFQPGTVPLYYLNKRKSDILSYQIYKNDELIYVLQKDKLGRAISTVRLKDSIVDDFSIYKYNDMDQLSTIYSDHNIKQYRYLNDSVVRITVKNIKRNLDKVTTEKYIFSDRLITKTSTSNINDDTSRYYNYLSVNGSRVQAVHIKKHDDTLGVYNYNYDSDDRIVNSSFIYKSDNWGDKRPFIFCDDKKEIIYNELGIICRKNYEENCGDGNFKLTKHHYNVEINLGIESKTAIIGFEQNGYLHKSMELQFNENNDIIKKVVTNIDKETVNTFKYEIVYLE